MAGSLLPLSLLPEGRQATIREIQSGPGLRQRLAELGLVRGLTVRIIQNDHWGPLIITLGSSRLALGRGMAHKIMIEEAGCTP